MIPNDIKSHRKNKFLKIGRTKGFISKPDELSVLKTKNNIFDILSNINFKSKKKIIYSFILVISICVGIIFLT